jgi:2-C-methyl-D-erythritol 4-phosphate cytidylyltransferase
MTALPAGRAMTARSIAVIIPAAGAGTRMGAQTPKQFLRLPTAPILVATVRHFARHRSVDRIVVVAPADRLARAERLLRPLGGRTTIQVVAGGRERQDSVALGIDALGSPCAPVIVVHDAVRPFITSALIDAVVAAALEHGAAICALPVRETIKRVRDGFVEATVDRAPLWSVQTPQAFRAELLREAHDKARRDGIRGTDDAMLVERLGPRVRVIPGLEQNLKITTAADLRVARRFLSRRLRPPGGRSVSGRLRPPGQPSVSRRPRPSSGRPRS